MFFRIITIKNSNLFSTFARLGMGASSSKLVLKLTLHGFASSLRLSAMAEKRLACHRANFLISSLRRISWRSTVKRSMTQRNFTWISWTGCNDMACRL